ncbi:hypothetical protein [Acidipropionibacterium timonense]|uniref:hypothetical protein n=1 Tax=Acidipropionibacterium timonense TaxID=2161818 RepID=UPI00103267AD|nr:hypothetical protein [Acidipropionibacterium timonense]
MNIDWASLGLVTIVTICVTVLIVAVVSGGALALDKARERAQGDAGGEVALVALGWFMIGLAGLVVLYGLYLLIPYFH